MTIKNLTHRQHVWLHELCHAAIGRLAGHNAILIKVYKSETKMHGFCRFRQQVPDLVQVAPYFLFKKMGIEVTRYDLLEASSVPGWWTYENHPFLEKVNLTKLFDTMKKHFRRSSLFGKDLEEAIKNI